MSNFLARSSNDPRARLDLLEQAANSTRVNSSANGVGTLNHRGSGGTGLFTPRSRMIIPSSSLLAALQPGSDVSSGSTPKYTITYGTYEDYIPTISGTSLVVATAANIITLSSTDTLVYMQCDFTYDAEGNITVVDAEIMSGTSVPATTVSGGTGTVYQQIFGITITFDGMGNAHVTAAPAIGGSQGFNVCLTGPTINGPWRV